MITLGDGGKAVYGKFVDALACKSEVECVVTVKVGEDGVKDIVVEIKQIHERLHVVVRSLARTDPGSVYFS